MARLVEDSDGTASRREQKEELAAAARWKQDPTVQVKAGFGNKAAKAGGEENPVVIQPPN
jgi:hypothetical protein